MERAGGKAANLARLLQAGFPVPPGFVITTDAYRAFVEANGLLPRILQRVRDLAAASPDLDAASAEIRDWFESGQIPPDLLNAILDTHGDLGAGRAVAVRSSATAEDLPGLSFAGQQESMLNVVGRSALLDAVRSCWSSLWTARALTYRQQHSIDPEQVALAVIVQQMVSPEASGVLFTANPVTGNFDETVVEATLGLGEALVSGQIEPDYYVVEHDSWTIVEKHLGQKEFASLPLAEGGTVRIERAQPGVQALPDPEIIELARLAGRVAEHFGFPQDIEWAWASGRLWLLQARRITTI